VRELEAVQELATKAGLSLREIAEMPVNNLTVVFGKTA